MIAPARIITDPTLPRPGWESCERRFYDPVDLVLVFETPDGVRRTLHAGVYQIVDDAIEAAGVSEWLPATADGKRRSKCGQWLIQPVSAT